MKKKPIITAILLLLIGVVSGVQAQNNFVRTDYYSSPRIIENSHVEFYDGLGYPEQSLDCFYSNMRKDLATLYEYDSHNRITKTWLPIPTSNNGPVARIDPNTLKLDANTGYGDANPYVETIYEPNALGRVSRQYQAGAVFRTQSKYVSTTYYTNTSTTIKLISIDLTLNEADLSRDYDNRMLDQTGSQNEDGTQSYTFTDRAGRTVMTRVANGMENIDTYYGYDAMGRLTLVITPEGVANLGSKTKLNLKTDSFIDKYCYLYRYDKRGDLCERLVPGGVREQLRFDGYGKLSIHYRGQLSYTPGSTTATQYPEYYFYDMQNRIKSVSVLVNTFNVSQYDPYQFVEVSGAGFTNKHPIREYLYDSYADVPQGLAFKIVGACKSYVQRPTGLKTYERLRLLDGLSNFNSLPAYTERAFYYDEEGRVCQTVETTPFGGISYCTFSYDYQGRLVNRTEQTKPLIMSKESSYSVAYEYDISGRLLNETTQVNNCNPVKVSYSYDNFGRVSKKEMGGLSAPATITETYKYNTQGWLTEQANNYFTASLQYYNPAKGTAPSYTGNITEWNWKHSDGAANTYAFTYDGLSRVVNTNQYLNGVLSNQHVEQGLTYDKNGNLKTLKRYSGGALSDNLTYSYTDGRLSSVSGKAYVYDRSGNLTNDGRNNLQISYNCLNLPHQVRQSPTELMRYQYLGDGTKFSALDSDSVGLLYIGSLVYFFDKTTTAPLESASFSGGRMHAAEGTTQTAPTVWYHLRDHLGSTRVIADRSGKVQDRRDYYTFGRSWPTSGAITSNRYLYNGKEQQWVGNAGLLDYGARLYDPSIGRWQTLDPLADKYYTVNPYVYVGNNPIKFIDPDGKEWRKALFYLNRSVSANLTIGIQAGLTIDLGRYEFGINANAASADIVRIENGELIDSKKVQRVQKTGEVGIGILSTATDISIVQEKNDDATTTITGTKSFSAMVGPFALETKEIGQKKTNQRGQTIETSEKTETNLKTRNIGIGASAILGAEIKLNVDDLLRAINELFKKD